MIFFKDYFKGEKNIGVFQSIILIIFLIMFSLILFLIFSKSKNYYKKCSSIPLKEDEVNKKNR